jgi:hypothetical protein
VVALVLAYYVLLRSVLRSQPELRRCLTRCRHCGIFLQIHVAPSGIHAEILKIPSQLRKKG